MNALDQQVTILRLVELRRRLKGTVEPIERLLLFVEHQLGGYHPICKPCMYAKGLIDRCECKSLDNAAQKGLMTR